MSSSNEEAARSLDLLYELGSSANYTLFDYQQDALDIMKSIPEQRNRQSSTQHKCLDIHTVGMPRISVPLRRSQAKSAHFIQEDEALRVSKMDVNDSVVPAVKVVDFIDSRVETLVDVPVVDSSSSSGGDSTSSDVSNLEADISNIVPSSVVFEPILELSSPYSLDTSELIVLHDEDNEFFDFHDNRLYIQDPGQRQVGHAVLNNTYVCSSRKDAAKKLEPVVRSVINGQNETVLCHAPCVCAHGVREAVMGEKGVLPRVLHSVLKYAATAKTHNTFLSLGLSIVGYSNDTMVDMQDRNRVLQSAGATLLSTCIGVSCDQVDVTPLTIPVPAVFSQATVRAFSALDGVLIDIKDALSRRHADISIVLFTLFIIQPKSFNDVHDMLDNVLGVPNDPSLYQHNRHPSKLRAGLFHAKDNEQLPFLRSLAHTSPFHSQKDTRRSKLHVVLSTPLSQECVCGSSISQSTMEAQMGRSIPVQHVSPPIQALLSVRQNPQLLFSSLVLGGQREFMLVASLADALVPKQLKQYTHIPYSSYLMIQMSMLKHDTLHCFQIPPGTITIKSNHYPTVNTTLQTALPAELTYAFTKLCTCSSHKKTYFLQSRLNASTAAMWRSVIPDIPWANKDATNSMLTSFVQKAPHRIPVVQVPVDVDIHNLQSSLSTELLCSNVHVLLHVGKSMASWLAVQLLCSGVRVEWKYNVEIQSVIFGWSTEDDTYHGKVLIHDESVDSEVLSSYIQSKPVIDVVQSDSVDDVIVANEDDDDEHSRSRTIVRAMPAVPQIPLPTFSLNFDSLSVCITSTSLVCHCQTIYSARNLQAEHDRIQKQSSCMASSQLDRFSEYEQFKLSPNVAEMLGYDEQGSDMVYPGIPGCDFPCIPFLPTLYANTESISIMNLLTSEMRYVSFKTQGPCIVALPVYTPELHYDFWLLGTTFGVSGRSTQQVTVTHSHKATQPIVSLENIKCRTGLSIVVCDDIADNIVDTKISVSPLGLLSLFPCFSNETLSTTFTGTRLFSGDRIIPYSQSISGLFISTFLPQNPALCLCHELFSLYVPAAEEQQVYKPFQGEWHPSSMMLSHIQTIMKSKKEGLALPPNMILTSQYTNAEMLSAALQNVRDRGSLTLPVFHIPLYKAVTCPKLMTFSNVFTPLVNQVSYANQLISSLLQPVKLMIHVCKPTYIRGNVNILKERSIPEHQVCGLDIEVPVALQLGQIPFVKSADQSASQRDAVMCENGLVPSQVSLVMLNSSLKHVKYSDEVQEPTIPTRFMSNAIHRTTFPWICIAMHPNPAVMHVLHSFHPETLPVAVPADTQGGFTDLVLRNLEFPIKVSRNPSFPSPDVFDLVNYVIGERCCSPWMVCVARHVSLKLGLLSPLVDALYRYSRLPEYPCSPTIMALSSAESISTYLSWLVSTNEQIGRSGLNISKERKLLDMASDQPTKAEYIPSSVKPATFSSVEALVDHSLTTLMPPKYAVMSPADVVCHSTRCVYAMQQCLCQTLYACPFTVQYGDTVVFKEQKDYMKLRKAYNFQRTYNQGKMHTVISEVGPKLYKGFTSVFIGSFSSSVINTSMLSKHASVNFIQPNIPPKIRGIHVGSTRIPLVLLLPLAWTNYPSGKINLTHNNDPHWNFDVKYRTRSLLSIPIFRGEGSDVGNSDIQVSDEKNDLTNTVTLCNDSSGLYPTGRFQLSCSVALIRVKEDKYYVSDDEHSENMDESAYLSDFDRSISVAASSNVSSTAIQIQHPDDTTTLNASNSEEFVSAFPKCSPTSIAVLRDIPSSIQEDSSRSEWNDSDFVEVSDEDDDEQSISTDDRVSNKVREWQEARRLRSIERMSIQERTKQMNLLKTPELLLKEPDAPPSPSVLCAESTTLNEAPLNIAPPPTIIAQTSTSRAPVQLKKRGEPRVDSDLKYGFSCPLDAQSLARSFQVPTALLSRLMSDAKQVNHSPVTAPLTHRQAQWLELAPKLYPRAKALWDQVSVKSYTMRMGLYQGSLWLLDGYAIELMITVYPVEQFFDSVKDEVNVHEKGGFKFPLMGIVSAQEFFPFTDTTPFDDDQVGSAQKCLDDDATKYGQCGCVALNKHRPARHFHCCPALLPSPGITSTPAPRNHVYFPMGVSTAKDHSSKACIVRILIPALSAFNLYRMQFDCEQLENFHDTMQALGVVSPSFSIHVLRHVDE